MKAPKINNDKYSDILWQNKNTGEVEYWLLRSENSASEIIGSSSQGMVGPGWNVVNNGDYNSDGIDDILWMNQNSGQVVWWDLAGGGQNTVHAIANIGLEWKAIPFYGTNATTVSPPPLLWFNTSTGQVVQWNLLNGEVKSITEVGRADPNAGWEALGSNAGKIYWRNQQTGETGYWTPSSNGQSWNRTENRGADWKFLGLGDFRNDESSQSSSGSTGISRPPGTLWQNTITGEVSTGYDETTFVTTNIFQTYFHTEHKTMTLGYAAQGWDAMVGQFTSQTAGQIPGNPPRGGVTDSILWHNQSTGESLVWDVGNGPGAFHTTNSVSSDWNII
ncbi:FG-GAP repeat domain-containing protein [Methylobacterium nonmethylotrophicum]|uniref:VCBS repeat-containing protein n=1 Tax=Methylobacterium nonmethylotrophicum TaxID=1141884 RepID=A0A4Z0NZA4_9HYPH|nr:VCBS repeat-containing protein [Methylobacterium nonmethylotrophicum]TGE02233.1 VCBS repeat-containing protein [Methylobacterium nonmethylotrophicum]